MKIMLACFHNNNEQNDPAMSICKKKMGEQRLRVCPHSIYYHSVFCALKSGEFVERALQIVENVRMLQTPRTCQISAII